MSKCTVTFAVRSTTSGSLARVCLRMQLRQRGTGGRDISRPYKAPDLQSLSGVRGRSPGAGRGQGSPEDLGDRCGVPLSSGLSGAGRLPAHQTQARATCAAPVQALAPCSTRTMKASCRMTQVKPFTFQAMVPRCSSGSAAPEEPGGLMMILTFSPPMPSSISP